MTFELLRRLCRQYTRRHSFPPVGGHRTWTDDAVDDLRGELLAEKGPVLVLNCYLRATDDPSLERLLLAAIGNYLKDEAKKTERGKLRRRLGTLLEQDPRFLRVRASSAGTAGWALTGGPDAPTAVGFEVVQRAAVSVRGVAITRLNPAGPPPERRGRPCWRSPTLSSRRPAERSLMSSWPGRWSPVSPCFHNPLSWSWPSTVFTIRPRRTRGNRRSRSASTQRRASCGVR